MDWAILIAVPLKLDETDVAIIKSLLKDGRKSFRQISRETKITTPTVKARFERLVNVGFIKGVIPIFDFDKVDNQDNSNQQQNSLIKIRTLKENEQENARENRNEMESRYANVFDKKITNIEDRIKNGLALTLVCDFCQGPVFDKPKILKFADIERFFCCTSCKANYSEKYRGRIESIKRKYEGKPEIDA